MSDYEAMEAREMMEDKLEELSTQIEQQQKTIERLKECVQWYAHKDNWYPQSKRSDSYYNVPAHLDSGEKAAQCLKEIG